MGRISKIIGTAAIAVACLAATPVAALAAPSQPETTTASPLEQLSASVQPAIVYLESTWTGWVFDTHRYGGQPWGYLREKPFSVTVRCTGFVVNPDGYIVTAGHCVEYSDDIEAAILSQAIEFDHSQYGGDLEDWIQYGLDNYRIDGQQRQGRPDLHVDTAFGIAVSGVSTGSVLPARVLAMRPFDKGDVALLKVEAKDLPSLMLAPEAEIGVGTEVVSVGYPASVDYVTDATFDPSFKDGSISSIKTIDDNLLEVYEISAAVSGGMSGGPTVDLAGQVVGLNSFGILGEEQPFNFIRPASIIQELLMDEGVTNEQGEVHQAYLAGLAAFFAGDKAAALENFDQVLALVPSHELAQKYRAEAARLPDPPVSESTNPRDVSRTAQPGQSSGFPLPIVAGLAALAAGVVGALTVARRRRPTAAAPAAVADQPTLVLPDLPPAPVAVPVNGHRFCLDCGAPQPLGSRFCGSCGASTVQQSHTV
jgi:S1-C subfamily serine protease